MALQVKNAPGQAGYVLLVFDQDIDASPLRLAVCNRISRTYLGHSVGKANWSPARSHFFEAVLVSRGDGETVFKVGPEVTTFIPDETTVELTSEDDAVREVTVWRSVLLDFHWKGPDVNPEDEARRLREEENLRRQRSEAERRRRDAEAESKRRAIEDEERRKLATQAAEAEKARQLAAAGWARKNAEDERKQIEAKAAEAERMRREAEAKAEAESKRRAAEDEEKRKLAAQAAEAEKARQLAAADWQRKNDEDERKQIEAKAAEAERMHREAEAKAEVENKLRAAEDEEKRKLAAQAAEAEKARQLAAADWQRKDADEEKRRDEQKQKEEEESRKQAEDEAKRKQEEEKALQAIVLEPAEEERALPENLTAPGDEGQKERARAYKGMVAVFAAIAALWIVSWGLEHRTDVCSTFGLFCEKTVVQASAPDFERDAFERARTCANGASCGVAGCIADYRRAYPDGRFKAQVDAIVAAKGLSCSSDTEKDVYDRAVACAALRSCDAIGCLADYRRAYPSGRFKSQIDAISATKGQACPANNLERQVYDRAIACAAPLTCGAMDCLTDYRRQFPSGYFIVQISVLAATKGLACPAQLPPFVRRTSEDPGINCNKPNLEPIEDMICQDGDIARVNGELQRAFDTKRLSLRGTARDTLVNQERAWIQSRDRDCNVPGRGPWSHMDLRRVKNCVIDKTRSRRDELQR